MKTSIIEAGTLIIIFTVLLFVFGKAVSDDIVPSQTSKTHSVSVESNHPLSMARYQLKQAYQHYSKGDIASVGNNLKAASKLLKDPKLSKDTKTNIEAAELVNKIQQLQAKINHPSDEHESEIKQLWHRSSALVSRELEHINKIWHDSSVANTIFTHLLNARLHISYAENELSGTHDTEKISKELNKAISYLDEADKIASPHVHEKIISLKRDIQELPTSPINTTEEQTIIHALETAKEYIDKASHSKSQEIQARSKKIGIEIINLKEEISMLERLPKYNSILERLRQLNELL